MMNISQVRRTYCLLIPRAPRTGRIQRLVATFFLALYLWMFAVSMAAADPGIPAPVGPANVGQGAGCKTGEV